MALSRLLGGSGRITLEADANRYASGDSVRLHAGVLDEYLSPVLDDSYEVMVRKSDDEDFEPMKLQLTSGSWERAFFKVIICLRHLEL